MMGFISGKVLFSDGKETIIQEKGGVGHQVYCHYILAESSLASLYLSHVIRETTDDLYGFQSLRDKKMFEMLISVKGVGPKSAYSLVTALGADNIVRGVQLEDKQELSLAPGIGLKAASQIILDLSKKIAKIRMYSKQNTNNLSGKSLSTFEDLQEEKDDTVNSILHDTVLACRELGLPQEKILGAAQRILSENKITRSEQLVHLVLKEM